MEKELCVVKKMEVIAMKNESDNDDNNNNVKLKT